MIIFHLIDNKKTLLIYLSGTTYRCFELYFFIQTQKGNSPKEKIIPEKELYEIDLSTCKQFRQCTGSIINVIKADNF